MKDFADGRPANSKVGVEMINLESTARPRNQNSVVITSLPATLMYRKSRKRERTCTLYATTTKRLKLETKNLTSICLSSSVPQNQTIAIKQRRHCRSWLKIYFVIHRRRFASCNTNRLRSTNTPIALSPIITSSILLHLYYFYRNLYFIC